MALTAEIKAKQDKLEQIKARVKATFEQHPKGLPSDKDLEVTTLLTEAKGLREQIEADTRLEAKKADLADLDKFLSDPIRTVPHGVNGDDDDQKALRAAGWEVKLGVWHKQTSIGVSVPMFGEDVLKGDLPERDPDQANYFRMTRAAMAPLYRKAYAQYIRNTAMAPQGMAFQMLSGEEQKALSEATDTAGGFLVPPDVQAEVLARMAQQAVIRRYARVQPTNRDILRWPTVAANATSGSIYSSGFVGGWVGETPAFVDTDPAFGLMDIAVKKLRVATKLSNDFVADAASNVLAFLAQNGAENMALVEDSGFINGDGGPLQPLGLLNAGITTFDVEGSTANTVSNTNAATGSAPKIIAGAYTLPAQYTSGARWLMRRNMEGKVRALVDNSNRPLWPPLTGSAFAAAPPELMGFPVENSDFMPDDGTDTNKVMVVGNLSNYIIAQRAQITSVVLRERFADTDQVGIILFERVGGAVFNVDAFRIGIV